MKHIVVDLEMNTIPKSTVARKYCGCETIEIGAVMLDDNMQEISSFRTYVKPEYSCSIANNIRKLTGITNEMVENAPLFNDAFRMFTNWCQGTGDEVTLYAWSQCDYDQIVKEIVLKDYQYSDTEWDLIENSFSDIQLLFDEKIGFERATSLKNAVNMAGLDFSGREHDALDDARNTADLLRILSDEKLFNKNLKSIEDVMKPKQGGFCLGDLFDLSGFAIA